MMHITIIGTITAMIIVDEFEFDFELFFELFLVVCEETQYLNQLLFEGKYKSMVSKKLEASFKYSKFFFLDIQKSVAVV